MPGSCASSGSPRWLPPWASSWGLFWQPLGIAAAVGFAITMAGAIGFHAKAGDYADPKTRGGAMAPFVLVLLAVAAAVTLAAAM
ncbi:hypothetical protein M2271_005537 [Streptomyces sp. LBL]|uniref:DoxX family protein n=1 Tax=Streptomyces sp. LBL TaxID=2940562 RepID=UPI00247373AA|nr:DoxX family protein [Streptomyces sp. LBL]MDH6627708.1 hypothetical protein [Streptomyces sp. LBL]